MNRYGFRHRTFGFFLILTLSLSARWAGAKEAPAVSQQNLDKKTLSETLRTPGVIHTRFLIGTFDQAGLLETLTQGQVSMKKAGTRIFGLEVGRLMATNLFKLPIDFSIDFAAIYNDVLGRGSNFFNFRLTPKLYLNIPWLGAPRVEFGMGPSYVTAMSADEEWAILDRDQQANTSRWLNAVVLGVDVNLGRIMSSRQLERWHLGIADEHRSGIFGLINGVFGGCDYKSLYAEYQF